MKGVLHYIEADLAELDFARDILAIEAGVLLARYAAFLQYLGD